MFNNSLKMYCFKFIITYIVAIGYNQLVIGAPLEDLVINLPGQPTPPPSFKHYSGYLNSTDDNHIHYWFFESQSNTSAASPVVVWLQGGPGCSGIFGCLTENGPFRINNDGKSVRYNEYGWNKVANLLYLESPAGTGYSYADNGSRLTDDDMTAAQNLAALHSFFKKFPEYAQNQLYISGESYGGIYVPTLSALILEDGSFHLKGFLVGNGVHSRTIMMKTSLINLGFHSVIESQILRDMINYCCPSGQIMNCNFSSTDELCKSAVDIGTDSVVSIITNPYYLYDDCPVMEIVSSVASRLSNLMKNGILNQEYLDEEFRVKSISNKNKPRVMEQRDPKCIDEYALHAYVNSAEFRAALHIPENLPEWFQCRGPLYKITYEDTAPFYKAVLNHGKKVLVYHGDADTVCNHLQGEYFVKGLGYNVTNGYRPLSLNYRTVGFVKNYENVTYVKIMNCGHMVPTNKPAEALLMFTNFIQDIPF